MPFRRPRPPCKVAPTYVILNPDATGTVIRQQPLYPAIAKPLILLAQYESLVDLP
ncbi:hypothetical protein ACFLYL_01620 [Chloroflexota bacterium]